MDSRTERIVIETSRHRIEGDLNLPREGYRSRLSDFLNRGDIDFIPLTSVEVKPIANGSDPRHHDFLAVARSHIETVFPL